MDCSLPGSSVHGIFQAIVLEWIAISFSRGSSLPRDQTQVSRIVDGCFTIWATREVETVADFILGGSKITAGGDCSHEIKTLTPWKESYDQARQHIKKQRHYFVHKGPSSQDYDFSSSHVERVGL